MQRREFIRKLMAAGAAAACGEAFIPFAEAADVPSFSFAHITDLHLDVQGTSTWQHREKSVPLFIDTLRQLGRLPQLKFVIFGGDQVHAGPHDRDSLFVFQEWSKQLAVPFYILLGNMEVSPVPAQSRLSKADYLNAWKGRGVAPGRTSWTADPARNVRIIGFDVTVEGKPYGEAGAERLRWLNEQLRAARGKKLVIVATHQLLQPTTPRDAMPEWSLWMTRDHAAVREMLEKHPNVRLVLSGHHHATRTETVNGITYAASPAVVTYPCAFRLVSVRPEGIAIRSIGLDEKAIVNKARELLLADPYARLYDPERPENVLAYSIGLAEQDRESFLPF